MLKSLLVAVLVLGSASAMAQGKKLRSANYGDAGCGLGAIVFGNERGASQIVASTLNATGMQTIAMSFGTSNCSNAFTSYIETNKDAIAKEMARGEGETLVGLLEVMGCQDKAAAASALQSNYNSIFPTTSVEASDVQKNIESTLQASNITCTEV